MDDVRASAMQPQVIISGLRMYMEGLNGMGDDFTSGTGGALTSPTTYVESGVRQRGGNSLFLPNSQGKILGALQVLRIVGSKVSAVLEPVPSKNQARYLKGNYRIICKLRNRMMRAVLTREKLELLMNNWVEVELPLRAVKDDSYLDGANRQILREGDRVGAVMCRPGKSADGNLEFTCKCIKKGGRRNRGRNNRRRNNRRRNRKTGAGGTR